MQATIQKRRIEDDDKKEAILGLIADKYCRTILTTTMIKPKSALDIALDTKIPISTVYRRVQMLYDNKLVRISGQISDNGKKLFLYKSRVKGILSAFNNDQIEIQIIPNIVKEIEN